MNAIAVYFVNDHMQALRAEAAANRAVKVHRTSLRERVASAIAVRNRPSGPTESGIGSLPKLTEYPYRG